MAKTTILPLPIVANDTVHLCHEGAWEEIKAGCKVFQPSLVSNPGWFASISSGATPEIGLNAALAGARRSHRSHPPRRRDPPPRPPRLLG